MLRQRVLTALLLAPLVLVGLFGLESGPFAIFTAGIVLVASWEWTNLAGVTTRRSRLVGILVAMLFMLMLWHTNAIHQTWPLWVALLGWALNLYWVVSYPATESQWKTTTGRLAMGGWVLLPCWVGFYHVRAEGAVWLLFVLLLVWFADTGAYFAGRRFGRRKLAPAVSPGKTWEGVMGGVVATTVLALSFVLWLRLSIEKSMVLVMITMVITLVSVLGDLLESMLKRSRGIKDSSALLPGHGGILDRIDSLTAAVPIFALLHSWI